MHLNISSVSPIGRVEQNSVAVGVAASEAAAHHHDNGAVVCAHTCHHCAHGNTGRVAGNPGESAGHSQPPIIKWLV